MDSVLVVFVYTKYKEYCRFLYPKIYDKLNYKNKSVVFLDEIDYPILSKQPTGEQVCSAGRQIGIEIARKLNPDWVLFHDLDLEPEPDTIQKLLAVKHPLVGGLVSARGNPWQVIGHNYTNKKTREREWLKQNNMKGNPTVDGISGAQLLVARGIYSRVDYKGYKGPNTYPGRFTADDEYLQIKIYESFKLRPKVATDCKSWHYNNDGRAYKLWGEVKQWREY